MLEEIRKLTLTEQKLKLTLKSRTHSHALY